MAEPVKKNKRNVEAREPSRVHTGPLDLDVVIRCDTREPDGSWDRMHIEEMGAEKPRLLVSIESTSGDGEACIVMTPTAAAKAAKALTQWLRHIGESTR